jgi:hypothetical protein
MSHKVRIFPKRRVIDVERLAEALLDLVAAIDDESKQESETQGDTPRRQVKGGHPGQKGSAA